MKFLSAVAMATLFVAGLSVAHAQSGPKPKLGVSLETDGLVLDQVTRGSVASKAGLKAGDLLVGWGMSPITDVDGVLKSISTAVPGSSSKFVVRRGGKTVELKFSLPAKFPDDGFVLGVTVGSGVYVSDVNEASAAAKAGIMAGDILTSFDGQVLETFDDLRDVLKDVRAGSMHKATLQRGASQLKMNVQFAGRRRDGFFDKAPGSPNSGPPKKGFPFDMKMLEGMQVPGMDMMKGLMSLETVKSDIDKSIAELKEMNIPALAATIKRLEISSSRLGEASGSMAGMRQMADSFMDGSFLKNMPGMEALMGEMMEGEMFEDGSMEEPEPEEEIEEEIKEEEVEDNPLRDDDEAFPNQGAMEKRIRELLSSGVTDAKELNKIIGKEFPGVSVQFGTSSDDEGDFDDFEDVPAKVKKKGKSKPTSKPTASPLRKSKSRPTSQPAKKK
ncbi:MAG: hypothetical protein ACI97A_002304 [Planctomycetota bacterium]|jgi:hypothetical protein